MVATLNNDHGNADWVGTENDDANRARNIGDGSTAARC